MGILSGNRIERGKENVSRGFVEMGFPFIL